SASSRSPRPRIRTEPCSATTARSALRCPAAQLAGSAPVSARTTGGLPGCSSTSVKDAKDECDMSVSLQSISANKHRLGRFGRAGAQEVVAAVGKLVPVDLAGRELPVAITNGRIGGARVVAAHYDRDRRGQLLRGRPVQGVREIVVRGHAVVPVGG